VTKFLHISSWVEIDIHMLYNLKQVLNIVHVEFKNESVDVKVFWKMSPTIWKCGKSIKLINYNHMHA
jgi:hypothetical protein